MATPPSLPESTLRSIVRLIGDVCAVEGGRDEKKKELMNGLCRLVGADSWAWGVARDVAPGEPSVHLSLLHGGFEKDTYAAFTTAYLHPGMTPLHSSIVSALRTTGSHVTRLRQQMDPGRISWSPPLGPLWQKADIDGVIMSIYPTEGHFLNIIGLYRRMGAPLFTTDENQIAHIVLAGIPWLHREGWDDTCSPLPLLTPRQRMTLDLLVQGYTRGSIANHLEISLHTANDHVKEVFRHFNVQSQAELIARFRGENDAGYRADL